MKRKVIKLFWFGISGSLGFIVDTCVFYLLSGIFGPYLGRLCSFLSAATFTWGFNRCITFKVKESSPNMQEFMLYVFCMVIGASINLGVSYILFYYDEIFREFPVLAIAAGSIASMGVNYLSSSIIWKNKC